MSTPSTDDTQQGSQSPAEKKEEGAAAPTMEEQLDTANKRYKDTQASYTTGQQTIKQRDAVIEELTKQLETATQVVISEEDQKVLDDLKFNDPEAWRVKLNQLETAAKGESKAKLEELTGSAGDAAKVKFELERRAQVLKEFNESAEVAITDELIANDVPPRITNKLANNKISFEEYLGEISEYLKTGKTVKEEKTLNQPDMGKIGGGDKPGDFKPEKSLSNNYKNDVY